MKKLFGAIFGSAKNTETIVDGAVKGLDKMFFTKEEKSEASAKVSEWFLKYLAATQPQNLARRIIAIMVVALWSALVLMTAIIYAFNEKWAQFIFELLRDVVMNPFLVIIGFYFAAHVLRSFNKKS